MQFTQPLFLFAFTGIIIPVIVHLWSRKEGRIINIGTVRFMEESEESRFSAIRLNEILLLILRSLLIILLVLILAGLEIKQKVSVDKMILIDRELISNTDLKELIDSLSELDHVKYFERGYPALGSVRQDIYNPIKEDKWSLLRDIQILGASEYVIYSPARIKNFHGSISALPENVTFISIPTRNIKTFLAGAYIDSNDTLQIVVGISNEESLHFIRERRHHATWLNDPIIGGKRIHLDWNNKKIWLFDEPENIIPIRDLPAFKVGIYYNPEFQVDARYMEAAFNAISNYGAAEIEVEKIIIDTNEVTNTDKDIFVFLPDLEYKLSDKMVFRLKEEIPGTNLVSFSEMKYQYFLTSRPNPRFTNDELLDELPNELFGKLINLDDINRVAEQFDQRKLSTEQLAMVSGNKRPSTGDNAFVKAENILWLLFLLTLVAERMISAIKRQ